MTIEYFPETDTLNITFVPTPYKQMDVVDTDDEHVVLLYDADARLAEIVIERASERIDLAEMRRKVSFEELRADAPTPSAA
jgi:uncharacterized protein YuzE